MTAVLLPFLQRTQYQESADETGQFHLESLPAGTYEVTFWLRGFFNRTISDIKTAAGETTDLGDIHLKPFVCGTFPGPVCNEQKTQPQYPVGFETTAIGPVPVLTVCQLLSDLTQYNGKLVIVVGRLTSTEEDTWLKQACDLNLVINGHAYPTVVSTTYSRDDFAAPAKPERFAWDDGLLPNAVNQVKSTTPLLASDKWCAMLGRVEADLPSPLSPRSGALQPGDWLEVTSGFGHLSAAPAQLIPANDGYLLLK